MQEIRYGQIKGTEIGYEHILAASQVILATSGHFVKRTANGTDTVTIAVAASAELLGWVECEPIASTIGNEARKVINDLTAVFRIPINAGTYVHLMKGKTCDLSVASSVQGAVLNSSTYDVVIIVGGDLEDNKWVDVMLNPLKMDVIGAPTVS